MQERPTALVTAAAAPVSAQHRDPPGADGFDVVITDIHERRRQELADKLAADFGREFTHHNLDVTDEAQVESVVAEIASTKGRLDVLVNNAGWSKIEPVAEMSSDTWRRCLDVDLNGTFYTMRYALPVMQQNKSGAIVNISSIAAYETSTEHGAAYSAAKAGVLALTRVAAAENGKFGIRVNAVTPGLIYNDFLRKIYPPDEFFSGYARIGHSWVVSAVPRTSPDWSPSSPARTRATSPVRCTGSAEGCIRMAEQYLPIRELTDAFARGDLCPVDVTDDVLARIERVNRRCTRTSSPSRNSPARRPPKQPIATATATAHRCSACRCRSRTPSISPTPKPLSDR